MKITGFQLEAIEKSHDCAIVCERCYSRLATRKWKAIVSMNDISAFYHGYLIIVTAPAQE